MVPSFLTLVVTSVFLTLVTGYPLNISDIHPQCTYTDCSNVTYVEQLDTNIYKVLAHPVTLARHQVPTCQRSEARMLGCSNLTDYFLDNGIKRARPLHMLQVENEPKPAECLIDSGNDKTSFPCCDFIYSSQFILAGDDALNPPPPSEGSGVSITRNPSAVFGYNILFKDSLDEDNIDAKWEELKKFLDSRGLNHTLDAYSIGDFSYPGAPEDNQYWLLSNAVL